MYNQNKRIILFLFSVSIDTVLEMYDRPAITDILCEGGKEGREGREGGGRHMHYSSHWSFLFRFLRELGSSNGREKSEEWIVEIWITLST